MKTFETQLLDIFPSNTIDPIAPQPVTKCQWGPAKLTSNAGEGEHLVMCRCDLHSQESLVLKMLACLCIYIYIYVCVCVCACCIWYMEVYTHTHRYVYIYITYIYISHLHTYTNTCLNMQMCVCVCLSIATPSDWCTNHICEHDPAGTCDHGAALESSEATNLLRAYWNGMATLGH